MKYRLCLSCIGILTACGGGSNNSAPPAPPPVDNNSASINGPQSARAGESVALLLLAEGMPGRVSWQQTAGPDVSLVSGQSQVLAFDVPEAGDFAFTVSFDTNQGRRSLDWQFSAAPSDEVKTNVRLDHLAAEGANVSLHADASQEVKSVTWQLLSGPNVTTELSTNGQYLFYSAPQVNQDTLMHWQATVTLVDGSTDTDDAWVMVKNVNANSQGFFPNYRNTVSSEAHAYLPDSPYADHLVDCTYNNQIASSCQFSRLPMLGTEHQAPAIQQVLERLVVTHDWMGDNFKHYLEESDPEVTADMLKLLRATTAVVIGYDIRPSFYWTATGAIYLDAANLWLSPEQRDSLNDQPDYRSDFGNDLRFYMPWRYVKDNQYYLSSYAKSPRQHRRFADMQASLTWLLYHELAHANDFFPYHSWSALAAGESPLAYSNEHGPSSATFSQRYPLLSAQMKGLAQVSFAGQTANATQRAYLPDDVASFFAPDRAVAYYSYSTEREDFANAFEMFMMSYRLGVQADTGVVGTKDNPQDLVSWGQRNRQNLPAIQPRVDFSVQNILPQLNIAQARQNMPAARLLPEGVAWRETVDLDGSAENVSGLNGHIKKTVRTPADRPVPYQH
ncbi:hypothetical protein [Bowmanella denitrificans]|uniref:hypothetical protein n=1 Tax=Bowmanella denitrificans TaxID=366582 RepID=UPI000C9A752D|nr:hypothetical protein [Bowmanella denitrificans]